MNYFAPVRDMEFVINELAGLDEIAELPGFEESTADLVSAVLEEAGKFSGEVLAPLNKTGDEEGSRLVDGKVVVPSGFSEAYEQFVECGWLGIGKDVEFGGQGMPHLVATAVDEMWNASNLSFSLCPLLTSGAVAALLKHADGSLKATYVAKMVSGEWAGTMNLTEPQAGSDLAAIRTEATPEDDHYRIRGQKIFITWGDQEMTENVIHLVLARLPDAPEGVRGISLFLVPKYLVNADGSIGSRNDIHVVSLEHKLGVHASPTCTVALGDTEGAVGYLVGKANRGLACMFTMMNAARLGTGLQGVAIADRAYQQAVAYAKERVQGSSTSGEGRVTIINHPDVRRMLMLMRSQTEAMRSVAYITGAFLDRAGHAPEEGDRQLSQQRVDLLTPIAKAWCTEVAQEVTTLGLQVHGGMGYIEDTGSAQHFRDGRITTIYEGTTGIQASDLVGRKILRDEGQAMRSLLGDIRAFEKTMPTDDERLAILRRELTSGREALADVTDWILTNAPSDRNAAGSVSVNLLMLMGTVIAGWHMARAAISAIKKLDGGTTEGSFYETKLVTARFYAEQVMPRIRAYRDAVVSGSESTMALEEHQF
ncbi:MAG: acyl-CoA dehydrogenase [Gammaproteobacteria bacterium]